MSVRFGDAPRSPPAASPLPMGVLLVDDHPVQREIHAELLRDLGVARVYEAGDGEQALRLLEELPEPPLLVLLDLEMPRMDGFETMRQLAHQRRDIAVIVASGGEAAVLESLHALAEELGVKLLGALPKPIDARRLSALIEHIGDEPGCRDPRPTHGAGICCRDLREAMRNGWLVPYYQPKLNLLTRRIDGVEALLRWREPCGREVQPQEFIPIAEREGLIDELTLRMLDRVAHEFRLRPMPGHRQIGVSVNVSPLSLSQPGFAEQLRQRIERRGFPARQFTFEITEGAVARDPAQALCALGRLRLQGFGLALDDYGTGFSSLQQLARMPFSEIKIDRSFVRHADVSQRQRTILESAIDVGRRLGIDTVAEGVETFEELRLLRHINCTHVQGYLVATPMPMQSLVDWLADADGVVAGLFRRSE